MAGSVGAPIVAGVTALSAAALADLAVAISAGRFPRLLHVIVDNSGHGLIALVVWVGSSVIELRGDYWPAAIRDLWSCLRLDLSASVAASQRPHSIVSALACGVISCLLDLDHFIAAGSVLLDGAMSLSKRPFGHSVTFIVAAVAILAAITRCFLPRAGHLWLLVLVAWLTHQLRDATRRGLWFWPLGSTPPVPYALYLFLIAVSPVVTWGTLQWIAGGRGCEAWPLLCGWRMQMFQPLSSGDFETANLTSAASGSNVTGSAATAESIPAPGGNGMDAEL